MEHKPRWPHLVWWLVYALILALTLCSHPHPKMV